MTIWTKLTNELMRQRTVALSTLALGTAYRHGWTPEDFVSALGCDECDTVVDLTSGPVDLTGWTTTGDLKLGFVDRCPDCSAVTS